MATKTLLPYSTLHLSKSKLIFLFTLSCIGIAFSIFSFIRIQDLELNNFSSEFKWEAKNRIFALQNNINDKINEVISLEAFFKSSDHVEREEFHSFANLLLQHKTGIQALEWIPRVPNAEREIFEELTRLEGFSDFQITERIKQGVMNRAKKHDEYFPVYYVEPYEGNEKALGFNLASNPRQVESLESSRDTAEMRATPMITLVQEMERQSAFLVYQPIYNQKEPPGSVEERQKEFKGFVLGVFRIGDLVNETLSSISLSGIDLYLFDASESDPAKRFLYSYASRTRLERSLPIKDESTLKQGYHYSSPVKVVDRTWQIYAVPTSFFAAHRIWHKWLVSVTIFIFTVFLVGYLYIVFIRAEESKQHEQALSEVVNKLELEIAERNRAEKALQETSKKLLNMAMQDGLTQIANRRNFDIKLTEEWRRMIRRKKPLSIIIFDVDHFKFYNDTYGHQAGDMCLQTIANKAVQYFKRPGDLLARYGGEEFAAILPNTTLEGANDLAEEVRLHIHEAKIHHDTSPVSNFVTISCGISSVIPNESTNSQILLGVADKALYDAKEQGRNRVVIRELN